MRLCTLLGGLAGLLLLGCGDSEPKANRGVSQPGGRTGTPRGEEEAQSAWPDQPLQDSGGKVRFGALSATAPEGWTRKPAQSSFTLAEFQLPRAAGDASDGRLTLSVAGGSIEANIERWKGQFANPREKKHAPLDVAGFTVTFVDLSGDFQDQRGPFAPAVQRPGYRMLAAIIPVDGQLHFVKAVGPEKTIEAQASKIKAFVAAVTPAN